MSEIGKILNPLYSAISWLLAFYYSLIPNYAVAISLLTLTVMVVIVPLTLKGTRSMIVMQQHQPQLNKIKAQHKNDRVAQQQAMTAYMRENGLSPLGGCLPMIIPFPIFLVLYEVVRGLTNIGPNHQPSPKYIGHTTLLYENLVHAGGKMVSFGIDLARSPTSAHGGFVAALPYWVMVLIAIALQYLQFRQMSSRNPQAAGGNPQVQQMQKFMPLIFGVIYIEFPAAVNVYFIVSTIFRIGQQSLMYRFDPKLRLAVQRGRTEPIETTGREVAKSPSERDNKPVRKGPAAKTPAQRGGPRPSQANGASAGSPGRSKSSRGEGRNGATRGEVERRGAKAGSPARADSSAKRARRGR